MSRARTVTLGVLAALTGLFVLAGPALAHVTVSAPGATPGGSDQQITFRVPVEENSPTTSVTIEFPTDTPIASLDVVPLPGWTHTEKTVKLAKPIKTDDGTLTTAVSQVTWTATSGGLQPGEIGLFDVVAGQLPDAHTLVFRAIQTYKDGTVVKWIEQAAPGSTAEPENPAPVLHLGAAAADPASAPSSPASASGSSGSSTTGPTVLSIIALVLAAAALGLAVVSRARRSSP